MAGRVRSDAERRGLLREWRRSGLSAREFGEALGISPWTLYGWARRWPSPSPSVRGRAVRRGLRGSSAASAFVEVVHRDGDLKLPRISERRSDPAITPGEPSPPRVELVLRNGRVLRVNADIAGELFGRLIAIAEAR